MHRWRDIRDRLNNSCSRRMPSHYMTAAGGGVSAAPQNVQFQTQDVTSSLPNYSSPQQTSTLSQPSSVGPGIGAQQASPLQQKGPSSVPSALYAQHHPAGEGATPSLSTTGGEGDKSSDEPLYSQKLELLNSYHEYIKRVLERNRYVFFFIYREPDNSVS
ncbi:unnamed protein product [Gongylonema pulchrum]|uniref:Uncharacterized protein n=1 Tax=Gongylonema pulchrum TaxID=637853 RepID=A0A3P7MNW6_9BILA|nr:unnamed protein product [Gongylonema pulchrum]